jgi:hypothetical protein
MKMTKKNDTNKSNTHFHLFGFDEKRIITSLVFGVAVLISAYAGNPASRKEMVKTSLKSNLEENFIKPGKEARPWTFWYWISGNATREGITYDLESMAEMGIGGAYIFAIDRPDYEKYVKVKDPAHPPMEKFWELAAFAVKEADRLGLEIAFNAGPGWSLAGGPWITPELSMQDLVSSTTVVEGGKTQKIRLERPNTEIKESQWRMSKYSDYYREIAVIAYPAASGWSNFSKDNLKPAQLITDYLTKYGAKGLRQSKWVENIPTESCVPFKQVINLSDKMDADGNLNWTPPAGKWVIQRFGYSTTGETSRPTGPLNRGLECDKFNPEAVKFQFENWYGEFVRRVGPELAGKTLSMNHSDSWECGAQTWSPVFRQEFLKRRGYDPVQYLPVTTGIAIGSAEESERFLWDYRRTILDLVVDNFFKTSVELTNKTGGVYSSETMAGTITDALEFYREVDVPMGEFWISTFGQGEKMLPRVSSGAHIYGKRFIQAEAFTERGIKWTEDPYYLKPLGDYSFANGVNRYAFHVWSHQAFPEKVPGITLFNVYGTVLGGHQTWHKLSRPWYDYVTRCQSMLQQGIPVADVCYFIGEELPSDAIQRSDLNPGLPFGYNYDCINRDALLTRTKAENGKMILPDGVSYKLLVLPKGKRMSPEVAKKIGELASAGVLVVGEKPTKTFSLSGYPNNDTELQNIVSSTWKNVIEKADLANLLTKNGTPFDVEFVNEDMSWIHRGDKVLERNKDFNSKEVDAKVKHLPELDMEYSSPSFASCHRKTDNADFYYLTNQELENREAVVAFRITGKQPELWHPESGEMRPLYDWYVKEGRTYIPLKFTPAESYFIVFRNEIKTPVKKAGNFAEYVSLKNIDGAWTVEFEPNRGAPAKIDLPELISLSEHSDLGVKHFSGIATYKRKVSIKPEILKRNVNERIILDLGDVRNIAEVTLNGKKIQSVWKPPFQVDVTNEIVSGENTVEIRVANTWKNRLIADAGLPMDKRITWTLFREDTGWFNPKKEKVIPSGLIGPVSIIKKTFLPLK